MDEEKKGAAGTMATVSEVTMQDIKRDLDELRGDLKQMVAGGFKAREKLADAKSRLWKSAHNLESCTEEQFKDAYDAIRRQGTRAVELGRENIEKRPLIILLSTLGIGLVLGRFLLRR
ncbi:MAG: hypothetical protein NTZ09_17625 [Candidatus Hydrogenedentes bacterium]|nr:hypothetical protein [Candidatus Hydrogenedentota bacterium]